MQDYTRDDMEVGRAIETLRAIRRFDGSPLDPGELDAILEAGRRAPSSMNEQRWAFIVVTERERLRELASVGEYADHLAGASTAIALVVPEADEGWRRESIAFDLGQCAQNLMLRAWSLGIGSAHAAVYDEALARRLLGYPKEWRCEYLLSLGRPARAPARPGSRRPLAHLLHRERW